MQPQPPADRWKAAGATAAVALCKFACENWSFENTKALAALQARARSSTHQLLGNLEWGLGMGGSGVATNWWA